MSEVPPVAVVPPQFDFGKPFSYVFDDPRWPQKIALGGLFYLLSIFIVGIFFVFGYAAQTTRNIINDLPRPLPEWEDLGEMFSEGARLFGVALVYSLPIVVLVAIAIVPAIALDALHNSALQVGAIVAIGCFALIAVLLWVAVVFLMPASLLFAVVQRRFGAAFEFRQIFLFVRANIGNYLLAFVVAIIARFVGGMGFWVLCIGMFFTAFWALLISAHAFAQVYRLAMRPPATP